MRRLALALAAIFSAGAIPVAAQEDIGPKRGTMGVEAPIGSGGSLLRFRSPTSATVLSIALSFTRQTEEDTAFSVLPDIRNIFFSEVRIGRRTYRSVDKRVRPYSTLSALVGYEDFTFQKGWRFGGAFETGVAYFFSDHVSAGVSNDFTLTYQVLDQANFASPDSKLKIIAVRFSGFRLMGAVYF
ncbi:MAG: hypothetical protein WD825_05095 [Gemmatimonadaceae bacterium]